MKRAHGDTLRRGGSATARQLRRQRCRQEAAARLARQLDGDGLLVSPAGALLARADSRKVRP